MNQWLDLYTKTKAEYGDFGMGSEALWALDFLNQKIGIGQGNGMIELGAGFGASFHCWAQFFVGPRVSIDLPTSLPASFRGTDFREKLWRHHLGEVDLYPIVGDTLSTVTIDTVRILLRGRQVQWLFIDADHSYDATIANFNTYKRFVAPGGYIGIHDLSSHTSVRRAWDELIVNNPNWTATFEGGGFGMIQI